MGDKDMNSLLWFLLMFCSGCLLLSDAQDVIYLFFPRRNLHLEKGAPYTGIFCITSRRMITSMPLRNKDIFFIVIAVGKSIEHHLVLNLPDEILVKHPR